MSDLYYRWNEAITKHFFNEAHAGKEVFLFVDDNRLAEIARDNQLPAGSFIDAVGSVGIDVANACLELCSDGQWRGKSDTPPYVAYLALFVLAAGHDEEDLPDNAYYNRLRRLLSLPDGPQLPGFAKLGDKAWSDLETWSTSDMDESLGVFRVRIQGAQRHVGIPRSQTLLRDDELKALPGIFATSGFDPTGEPSDSALAAALLSHQRLIRPPTLRTLHRRNDDVMRRALLEAVRDELWRWDGAVDDNDDSPDKRIHGWVRICIRLNEARRNGMSSMRCSLACPFPDGDLELIGPDGKCYSCADFSAPWSTQLSLDGEIANAADLDWDSGLTLTSGQNYEFRLRGSPVKLFEHGEYHRLPGWVEASRIAQDREYLIACSDRIFSDLTTWAATACDEFESFDYSGVLPASWKCIRVRNIRDDRWLASISPLLAFPSTTHIRLVGGVKSGRGAKYYAFAPPSIQVTSDVDQFTVSIGEQSVETTESGRAALPPGLAVGERITIRVSDQNGGQLDSKSLLLVDEVDWSSDEVPIRINEFGQAGSAPGFCGAYADPPLNEGIDVGMKDYADPNTHLVLIGRCPGQITRWPVSPWPLWNPVWAIRPERRGGKGRSVIYCGDSPESDTPVVSNRVGGKKKVYQWKTQINSRRRRPSAPAVPRLAELWHEYADAAASV